MARKPNARSAARANSGALEVAKRAVDRTYLKKQQSKSRDRYGNAD